MLETEGCHYLYLADEETEIQGKKKKKTRYLSQVAPSTGSWAKMWKTVIRPPKARVLSEALLVSEQMVSKFRLICSTSYFQTMVTAAIISPLSGVYLALQFLSSCFCPWHNDQATLNLVSGSHLFFWRWSQGSTQRNNTVIRYQWPDFYQGCLTLEFIIPFLTTICQLPWYNIWTQLLYICYPLICNTNFTP